MKIRKMENSFSKSEQYLERALKTIPLGSQTFSKSKVQYPFGVSPYFAKKAKGAYVWDVDNNQYIDFINGLCSITLGHCEESVINAVKEQLELGSIFSLGHELEFLVAEKICKLVPSAEKVRFGKNGSDATAGAIRLARAYTKRDHVAVCGYHGWQDWYIGSTSKNAGVPQATQDLTHTFQYNNIESLKTLLEENKGKIAAVILEPINVVLPKDNFLEDVKKLAHEHDAVLIFDETITGFRYANGGAQAYFNVTPDLSTFGKGLANGYPLSAIAGKSEIMDLMEDIFFSFTFGGETLSLAAALNVLTRLENEPIIDKLWETGNYLLDNLQKLIDDKNLTDKFSLWGTAVFSGCTPTATGDELWLIKTLFMQEMIGSGILSLGTHNISYAHTKEHVDILLEAYASFFDKVSSTSDIKSLLKCEPIEPLFKVR